jgi:hypothetical protein
MAIKRQIYIIILIFFLLSASLLVFFVYPLIKELSHNSAEIILHKKNVSVLENEFIDAQKFYKKQQDYQSNLDKLEQMFVDSYNPVDFIKFIEENSSNFNVQTEISTPLFYDEESLPYTLLQISCSGNFSDILKFVNAIEMGKYLIEVKSLDLSKIEKEKTQALILLKVLAK